MIYISDHGQETRLASRPPRHAHSQDADARGAARLWHCALHQASLRSCVDCVGRLSLSRPATAAAAELGEGRVEDDRYQPASTFLYAHTGGAQTTGGRAFAFRADDLGDRAGTERCAGGLDGNEVSEQAFPVVWPPAVSRRT